MISDWQWTATPMSVLFRCSGTGRLAAVVQDTEVAAIDCDGSVYDEQVVDVPSELAAGLATTSTHTLSTTWTGDPLAEFTVAAYTAKG